MELSDFLKKTRSALQLSVRCMAQNMGVNQYRLQKWETGCMPNAEDGEKIKTYLNIYSFKNLSEDFLKEVIGKLTGQITPLHQPGSESDYKTLLLKEKDKRIKDLERTIRVLESALEMANGKRTNL